MDYAQLVLEAERRIRPFIEKTPLVSSRFLGNEMKAELLLKCENLQRTGSFKIRGAFNKLLSLPDSGKQRQVVTASTGNHGAAVAYAAEKLGAIATVFVPTTAHGGKIAAIERIGAIIHRDGGDCVETEAIARDFARRHDQVYVSPYNDPAIIGGQGTVAVELEQQASNLDAVFVAIGGGGLCSGIAAYLKKVSPQTRIIGCSPEPSAVMIQSVKAGKILDLESGPTLSDGTAGGVEAGSITFPLIAKLVDEFVVVPESETRRAFREFLESEQMFIEGAAAMVLAACRMRANDFRSGSVAAVLCGGNVDIATLKEILK